VTSAGPALERHLRAWLGAWPPELPLDLVGSDARRGPDARGEVTPLVGVLDPDPPGLGEPGLLLSVPPDVVEPLELLGGLDPDVLRQPPWRAAAAQALGAPGRDLRVRVLRWIEDAAAVAPLEDVGTWVDPHAEVPSADGVEADALLVVRDDAGPHLATAAVTHLGATGAWVEVTVAAEARGRGLGSRVAAAAARRILREGRVALGGTPPRGGAASRVADAVGAPDRGWRMVDLAPAS
jgi:GNAT superfamily N-acetyltransferase